MSECPTCGQEADDEDTFEMSGKSGLGQMMTAALAVAVRDRKHFVVCINVVDV